MGSARLPHISKFVVNSICMTNNMVVVGAVTPPFPTVSKGKGITWAQIKVMLLCAWVQRAKTSRGPY
jgi:hypothetical protein